MNPRFRLAPLVLLSLSICGSGLAPADTPAAPAALARPDGQHDFDFEFGEWRARVKRRVAPLSGSNEWIEYSGPSIVRKVWDGNANLGEIDLTGPKGERLRGLSLRLYDPTTHEWRIHWANRSDGSVGPAMVGGFRGGRGEFYDQETFQGHSIYVRFIFSEITAKSFRIEQAFSADGGQSWEPNWIATFERQP